MKLSHYALLLLGGLFTACPPPPANLSPFPDLEIKGKVLDARGGGLGGVNVHLWNRFDSKETRTNAEGEFALVIDGANEASSIELRQAHYRPFISSVLLDDKHQELGDYALISSQEILFSTLSGGIYMLRADGYAPPLKIINTPDTINVTPFSSESGHTIKWANIGDGSVYEASWDGADVRAVYNVGEGYALLGISCGERGTFVSRMNQETGELDIIIAEDPPSVDLFYEWPGRLPDESPAIFGTRRLYGSLLAFSGAVEDYQNTGETRYGLFTAYPYLYEELYAPEHLKGTQTNDLYPRWSSLHEDGSLDLLFGRGSALYISHVTLDGTQSYSTPTLLYGDSPNSINANRTAWSLSEPGETEKIVFAVNIFSSGSTLAERGDIVSLEYDPKTGEVGEPTVIYDADSGLGLAVSVDWR